MPRTPQSHATHRRWFPLFHFVVQPLLVTAIALAIAGVRRTPDRLHVWALILTVAVEALAISARLMALTVQNRVIRLEMWLRLGAVLPADLKPRIPELRVSQLLGLRFAPDAELPELVRRCLAGELAGSGAVKREIRNWQGDYLRA